MPLDIWIAVWAGFIAGVGLIGTRLALRAAGVDLRMNVALMWSTMFRVHGRRGVTFGLAMHLLVSAAVGVAYAWIFATVLRVTDALWLWGLLGGVSHWLLAGVFLAVAPATNPEMPEEIPAPGAFAAKLGRGDVLAFAAGHLVYGLVFGITYGFLHPIGAGSAAF